ncbi:beta-glucosidase-like SFR2, chloroplastic isoform X1 [Selaginella moellendorffii]|uniref:beta-glucosidase-like SFR2, chloroplastic isoform X1 n=1 Tax=Selaginella moellendorffii TaxID=88036 RepID=UPI000D1CF8A3|nr:beta-glucosidase-like SFR2, chloroplastic isoform X1 [Selaginella moellendorffii]|eukprot:XP_024540094.1 beta-glucosidase-like SFR2, chloroplastic isoform X1 [Selaginella moellendorffii]
MSRAGFFFWLGFIGVVYAIVCGWILERQSPKARLLSGDEAPVLADFSTCNVEPPDFSCEREFFFGLATAPAHVEDKLNDSWLEFAQEKRFNVRAWHNIPQPDERLRFWSNPEVELKLAKETGVSVFRLGIDWGRIVIAEPVNGIEQVVDKAAVEQYKKILKSVLDHGMRVMLTLFHHSLPKWALPYGGWTDTRTIKYFTEFARFADENFGEYVDYWVTFNEPHIFALLTHCSGTWPPGVRLSLFSSLLCFSPLGDYGKAIRAISSAHIAAYDVLHERNPKAVVGVAHHVGVIKPYGFLDIPASLLSKWLTQFHWIDLIQDHLDFCGINYYGQEILSAAGLMLDEREEYSEAGRGVYPNGLLEILEAFHDRYKTRKPELRYIITENGFSDARDILRRPYLIEHLLAVSTALKKGIPIDGYIHWTISDNWEWADGYCPKFGLVSVDRFNDLRRVPRPSYYLYQQIVRGRRVTRQMRVEAWDVLQKEVRRGSMRPFCRGFDAHGRMWADGLDTPAMRAYSAKDWRFGEYQSPGIVIYAGRSLDVLRILASDTIKALKNLIASDKH